MKYTSESIVTRHKVMEVEHDSWSGVECLEKYFETKAAAMSSVKAINSKNTAKEIPSFYVTAEYNGEVEGVIIDGKFRELK